MDFLNFAVVLGGICTIVALTATFWPLKKDRFSVNKKVTLVVSNIDEETATALRNRAQLNGVSVEEEHRSILEKALLTKH